MHLERLDGMTEDFNYKIMTKNNFVIVTFRGQMNKQAKAQLEACLQDLLVFESKVIILLFKDVLAIDVSVLREIAFIQQEIRKKNRKLFLTGLKGSLKTFLYDKGVIRLTEVQPSLEDILNDKKNQI